MKRAPSAMRVLANPIAYRILAAIGMRGPLTTRDIARVIAGVPTSSLYRQLARLRGAGLLRVAGERQGRGALERTYALSSPDVGAFGHTDFDALPIAERRAAIRTFMARLVADTSAYLESKAFARNRSPLGASLAICQLTETEYRNAMKKVIEAVTRSGTQAVGGPSAKRRCFYLVALPEVATR